jgi:hypothetical protein
VFFESQQVVPATQNSAQSVENIQSNKLITLLGTDKAAFWIRSRQDYLGPGKQKSRNLVSKTGGKAA